MIYIIECANNLSSRRSSAWHRLIVLLVRVTTSIYSIRLNGADVAHVSGIFVQRRSLLSWPVL